MLGCVELRDYRGEYILGPPDRVAWVARCRSLGYSVLSPQEALQVLHFLHVPAAAFEELRVHAHDAHHSRAWLEEQLRSGLRLRMARRDPFGLSGRSAAGTPRAAEAAIPAPEPELTFVEVELRTESGDPMTDEEYELQLPDGSTRTGRTDSEGRLSVRGISVGGAARVRFPRLEASHRVGA